METLETPIFKTAYELYKTFYLFRNNIARQDRYTIWQKCENVLIDILENIILASQLPKPQKLPFLEKTSVKLNLLKVFIRLLKDVKIIDLKKYVKLEEMTDEIGRMLGGWLKNLKQNTLL